MVLHLVLVLNTIPIGTNDKVDIFNVKGLKIMDQTCALQLLTKSLLVRTFSKTPAKPSLLSHTTILATKLLNKLLLSSLAILTLSLSISALHVRKSRQTIFTHFLALGTYIYETATASSCRNYYFYFKSASGSEFYFPETGSLQTFKVKSRQKAILVMCEQEGSCSSAWVAGRTAGTATTDSGSTTSSSSSSTTGATIGTTTTTTTTTTTAAATTGAVTTEVVTTGSVATTAAATTGVVTTTGFSTTGAPNLFFGTTICYLSLVIQGDYSTFDQTAFAKNFADTVGISSSRVLIQAVSSGSFTNSVKIDFTLLELSGETASQTVMFAAFNLVFSRDPAFPNHGINVFTINGWFFTNTNGASIPATSNATPAFSFDATKDQESSSKSSNAALIGGVVGGAVGLVAIVGAVVAVVVIRKRRGASSPGSFF